MAALHTNPLVADYLRRLEAAAEGLPPQRRAELLGEIGEHIDDALRTAGTADEAAVRNALERLGPPEDIVAAAAEPSMEPPSLERRRVGVLEIAALLALLVPLVGWVVGAILVMLSHAWTNRERVVALLLPAAAMLLSVALTLAVPGDADLGPLETALVFGLGFVGGPLAAIYLAWRLRSARS